MIECYECGEKIDEDDVMHECPFCGEYDMAEGYYECPNCGALMDWAGDEWECEYCGNEGADENMTSGSIQKKPISNVQAAVLSWKMRMTYVIVAGRTSIRDGSVNTTVKNIGSELPISIF